MSPIIPIPLPTDAPRYGVRFNSEWLPIILSSLQAYERNYLYDVSPSELIDIMAQIERLIAVFTDAKPMTLTGLPIGTFIDNVGILDISTGWARCDGSGLYLPDYQEIYDWMVIQNDTYDAQWEIVEDTGIFLPTIFQRRTRVGVSPAESATNPAGDYGGSTTHTLTTSELPTHNHDYGIYAITPSSGSSAGVAAQGGSGAPTFYGNTANKGDGAAHNNMSPYINVFTYLSVK
jgi:microcystin-dependent protein